MPLALFLVSVTRGEPGPRHPGYERDRAVARSLKTLAADAEAADQGLVACLVAGLHVVQQLTAASHQLQKATAAVVVLLVGLEVLGQGRDARGQDRNLHLRRT